MTAAIIEDEKQKKDAYEFLEEDDDFEEFETGNQVGSGGMDREMSMEPDKKLWYE